MNQTYSPKSYKSYKDKKYESQLNKFQSLNEQFKIRILQYDLVFVNGLPSQISSKQILNQDIYFPRYGKVIKTVLKPELPFKKGTLSQAYATYQNQLNASLAIVALNGFILGQKPLKVSYGTTKYCIHFLKGKQCTNLECFYLHQIYRQRQVQGCPQTKNLFEKQNDRAINIVLNNLQQIIQRILDSKVQHIQEGFPSLSQMIQFLIDSEFLDGKYYYQIFDQIKEKRKKRQKLGKEKRKTGKNQKNIKILQTPNKNKNQKIEQQEFPIQQNPKLIKSNSLSTMTTPNKLCFSQFDQEQKKQKNKVCVNMTAQKSSHHLDFDNRERQEQIQIQTNFNYEVKQKIQQYNRVCRSEDQINNKISQNNQKSYENNLEQRISNKIIKEIMNKKLLKSRLDFVKFQSKNTQMIEEVKKVKNIMQNMLIRFQ